MTWSVRRLYRRIRYGTPIVVVSGLPRSGTSMIMKMLEAGGMSPVMDGVRTADEDNPKGYFEDERVKDLARNPDRDWLAAARGRVIKVISSLLKTLPPTNNYQVLFIRRNLHEVLASQAKMLKRRGQSSATDDDRMRRLFEDDLWRAAYLLGHAPQFEVLELHHHEILADGTIQARRIRDFLGRRLDVEKMAGVVDRQLYRNRFQGDPS